MQALTPICPECGAVLKNWPAHGPERRDHACEWSPDAALRDSLRGTAKVLDLRLPVNGSPVLIQPQGAHLALLAVGVGGAEDAEGGIVVVDPATWTELWRLPVGSGVTGLLSVGRRIVFGDARGYVHALNLDSRQHQSTVTALGGPIISAPALFDPHIAVVTTGTGVVARIDLRTLAPCGVYAVPGAAGGGAVRLDGNVTVVGQELLLGTYEDFGLSGRLLQVDPIRRSARTIATFSAGIYGSPLVRDRGCALVVLSDAADEQAAVAAVDLRSGRELGRFPAAARIRAMPTLDNGVLYIGSQDHSLYAVDARTLRPHWTFSWKHGITSRPLVMSDLVLFGDNRGMVVAVDREVPGEQPAWQQAAPAPLPDRRTPMVLGAPVVVGGNVVFGDRSGHLQVVPSLGGNLAWGQRHAERRGDPLAAAVFVMLQGGRQPARALKSAAALLERHECLGEAALCYEASDNLTEAAAAFERAGLWRKAADCYERLQQPVRMGECLEAEARADNLPFLHVRPVDCTALKAGEWSRLTLHVENLLPAKARRIKLSVAPVPEGASLQLELPPAVVELAKGAHAWQPMFRFRPNAAGELTLALRLDFMDDSMTRNQVQHFTVKSMAVAGPDQPPITIHIERYFGENATSIAGDVGYLTGRGGAVDVGGSVGVVT